jgi:hypothetical protein
MKKRFLLILVSMLIVLGLFWLTNEMLTSKFEWWTIPILFTAWIACIMGIMLLFDLTTESDPTKGEEDRRVGRSDEWPEEAEQ